uniref:Uncharacterized protein n=1 Tax=Arion vulgaris TaxID=1028688 RepID=A0A0B6YBE5_9EUPU
MLQHIDESWTIKQALKTKINSSTTKWDREIFKTFEVKEEGKYIHSPRSEY